MTGQLFFNVASTVASFEIDLASASSNRGAEVLPSGAEPLYIWGSRSVRAEHSAVLVGPAERRVRRGWHLNHRRGTAFCDCDPQVNKQQ